jgi:hypothetical protein
MTMLQAKPVPQPDADSRPYWDGANQGQFMYQRCRSCTRAQFYSRSLCSHCRSGELDWHAAQGGGRIASFTVVSRAPTAAFAGDAPYVIALIDLQEGIRFMCNVIGCSPDSVRIGLPVKLVFESRPGSDQRIPQVMLA